MKRLSLSIFLIILASSVLLISDLNQRKQSDSIIPTMAILQYSSHIILNNGVEGIMDGLEEKGFVKGQNISIKLFNSEGDLPTTNIIAKEITSGKFDYVLTVSTPAMQAVANSNKQGKTIQIFGLVTDPFIYGVGLDKDHPELHPRHLLGYGSFLPVTEVIKIAKELYPPLKSIGLAWNAAESNSEDYTLLAREYTKEIGIELLEANVDTSSAVFETVSSLVSRGVDMILVTGDNTVFLALDNVVDAANRGKIPTITITPTSPNKGTLFDLGADFYEVGKLQGHLAARIINGEDPSTIPIENVVPRVLAVNKKVLNTLKDPWTLSDELIQKADIVVDEDGKEIIKNKSKEQSAENRKPLTKKWNINIVEFMDISDVEETRQGVLEGLKLAGLRENKDYEIKIQNAQGDMPTVSLMIDNALSQGADMIITLSTPTLQAAIRRAKNIPIVFTYCASGVNAGAGKTNEDHLPNVTGVYALAAYNEMMTLFKKLMPSAKRVGTLFNPAESNSVLHEKILTNEAKKFGVELISLPANTSTEVPDAALALAANDIDAIIQIPGNLTAVSFSSIAKAANQARLPVFAFQTNQAYDGASVVLAKDYYDFGKEAAFLAARVMRGENPKDIPFMGLSGIKLVLNLKAAKLTKLKIPESLIADALTVIK